MRAMEKISRATSPWIARWLLLIAAMIFTTLIVGGATRLTKSGLSITEWKPIMGALPPFNDADWQGAFKNYQQSSQYKLMNQGMALDDFKYIFWWEWAHRFLDRLIGFAFALPLLYFAATAQLPRRLWPRLIMIFIAGGLEGVVGWFMVASGLVGRVSVSQYFLAAHLTIAALLFAAVLWTNLGLRKTVRSTQRNLPWLALTILLLIFMQIAAGGFVAGLDAGQGYNTWPLMDGNFLPSGLGAVDPLWRNFFENALTVQFDHRLLAYVILVLTALHAIASRKSSSSLLLGAVILQAGLGIATLLLHVPIALALIHQGGALILLTAALWNLDCQLRRETTSA
jgi:cytochrome c oxidase assembly protein subunit 15